MRKSKFTFAELMVHLHEGCPPATSKSKRIEHIMAIVRRMADNRKEMDVLNREFDKLFFVDEQASTFFKR